jgi:predicted DCC family thiol-disulfide oxidoreductase YuxK
MDVHTMPRDHSTRFASVHYRDQPGAPDFPQDRPILIFDGHCILCSRFARFILRHDRRAVFRLMAAQSPLGQAIFAHLGLDPVHFETNVLLEQGLARFKADGTIRAAVLLGFPWSLLAALRVVPLGLLDRVYDMIARNRLKWFGMQSTCFLPDPRYADRFLQ